MNPFERVIRAVDAWQQRHRVPAFIFAVFKKFGDDHAGNLVALLTYFAFLATFPRRAVNLLGLRKLPVKILAYALSTAIDIGLFFAAFRSATARTIATRDLLLGAIFSSIAWRSCSASPGSSLPKISNTPKGSPASSVSFLGMLAWFGLQATATVCAVEAGVVRAAPPLASKHHWATPNHRRQARPAGHRRGSDSTSRTESQRPVHRRRRPRPAPPARTPHRKASRQ